MERLYRARRYAPSTLQAVVDARDSRTRDQRHRDEQAQYEGHLRRIEQARERRERWYRVAQVD